MGGAGGVTCVYTLAFRISLSKALYLYYLHAIPWDFFSHQDPASWGPVKNSAVPGHNLGHPGRHCFLGLDELAKVEVRLRLRWRQEGYRNHSFREGFSGGDIPDGSMGFCCDVWIYKLCMKHQVYRCLLAKLNQIYQGKQRVFKLFFCIRFDVLIVPYSPVKMLGIPRKPHMDMPCQIRGFNRIR